MYRLFILGSGMKYALLVALLMPWQYASAKAPKSEDDKILYTLGTVLARNLDQFRLTKEEAAMVLQGFTTKIKGEKLLVEMEAYGPKIRGWHQARTKKISEEDSKKYKAEGKTFMEKILKDKKSVKLDSGVVYQVLKEGTGEMPKATDRVKVHYHGTLTDGTVFDSSVERKSPATFGLNQVIKCWTEGVQKIKVGGKSKLFCPSDVAYGDRGSPPKIPAGATLVFDVELLEIVKDKPAKGGHDHSGHDHGSHDDKAKNKKK